MTDYPELGNILRDLDIDEEITLPELPKRKGRQPSFDTQKAYFLLSVGIGQAEVAEMVHTSKKSIASFVKSLSPQTQEYITARAEKFAARQSAKAATAAEKNSPATQAETDPPESTPPDAPEVVVNVTVPPGVTAQELFKEAYRAIQAIPSEAVPPWYEVTAARIAPVLASLRAEDGAVTLGAVHSLINTIVRQDFLRYQSQHGGEPNADTAPS